MPRSESNSRLRRIALLIAFSYTLLASVWMLGAFLTSSADTREELIQARIIKDSIFISVSSLMLYSVIYAAMRRIHHSERALQAERALREASDHLRSVVHNSPVAIMTTDPQGVIQTWNRAAEELFGWTETEVHGGHDPSIPSDRREDARLYRQRVMRGEKVWEVEARRVRKDSAPLDVLLSAAPLYGPDGTTITSVITFCSDLTERKQQAQRVRHLATHDALTGLPNRRILEDHLARAVEKMKRGQGGGALLLLDLDSFKGINDQLGHAMGDQFLIQIARVLEETMSAGDVVTRFGGDEFAILLERVTPAEARAAAEKVRAAVAAHRFAHEEQIFDTTASVGIAPVSVESGVEGVMMMADTALHMAKDEGKNRVVVYEPGNQSFSKLTECSRWATRIKEALRDNRFALYFQPVVRLSDESPQHYEALIRMKDEQGRIIAPGAFLGAAEQFGLMPRIDRWVVAKVIDMLIARPELNIFVNLSGSSLADRGLLAYIEDRVRTCSLTPGRLVFEITETAAVTDLNHAHQWMLHLAEQGCHFALDDFGIAFSSFTYLRELPVQYVKLDGSFVKNLDRNASDRAMVMALNTVAHSLGKKVIAEWVENKTIADALRDIGVEYGQGYHWSPPKPEPEPTAPAAAPVDASRATAAA